MKSSLPGGCGKLLRSWRGEWHTVGRIITIGWNRKPGNFYSKPRKITISENGSENIKITMDQKISPIEPPEDTKYIKYVKMKSELAKRRFLLDKTEGSKRGGKNTHGRRPRQHLFPLRRRRSVQRRLRGQRGRGRGRGRRQGIGRKIGTASGFLRQGTE